MMSRVIRIGLLCLLTLWGASLVLAEEVDDAHKLNFGFTIKQHNDNEPRAVIELTCGIVGEVEPASLAEVPTLIANTAAEDDLTRNTAILRLVKTGDPAVAAMAAAFTKSSGQQRLYIGMVLTAIGTPTAFTALHSVPIDPLLEDLKGNNEEVRSSSILLLAIIGGERSHQALRPFFNTEQQNYVVPIIMGSALGQRREWLPEVEQCLRASDQGVRMMAVLVYYSLKGKDAGAKLITLLDDKEPIVRSTALMYAKYCDMPQITDAAITLLLFDPEPSVRGAAAILLPDNYPPEIIPYLIRASQDTNAMVRAGVAFMLGKSKDKNPVVIEALQALQNDTDTAVRKAAASALL